MPVLVLLIISLFIGPYAQATTLSSIVDERKQGPKYFAKIEMKKKHFSIKAI